MTLDHGQGGADMRTIIETATLMITATLAAALMAVAMFLVILAVSFLIW
jgi:hypothetical protein